MRHTLLALTLAAGAALAQTAESDRVAADLVKVEQAQRVARQAAAAKVEPPAKQETDTGELVIGLGLVGLGAASLLLLNRRR